MKLNLTMIADKLPKEQMTYVLLDKMFTRRLRYVLLYEGGDEFEDSGLYLAKGEELPQEIFMDKRFSMISIGMPPKVFLEGNCDIICMEACLSLAEVHNQVQRIFSMYDLFESRMQQVTQNHFGLQVLEKLIYEMFGNPVFLYDRHGRLLLFGCDEKRKQEIDFHTGEFLDVGIYPREENLERWMNDDDFRKGMSRREPFYFQKGLWPINAIFMNLYEGDKYLGHVEVDDFFCPLKDSYFPMTEWLASFLKTYVLGAYRSSLGPSVRFDDIMERLVFEEKAWNDSYIDVIADMGWKVNDEFVVAQLNICRDSADRELYETANWLCSLFEKSYFLADGNHIILIIDLSCCHMKVNDVKQKLEKVTENSDMMIGISSRFTDFRYLWNYYHQADVCCENATKANRIQFFDDRVLSLMISCMTAKEDAEFFYTHAVWALISYDRENGTELCKTLKVYLNTNLGAKKSMDELNVARSTFLYRIRRIQEVSGIDIEDGRTQNYLRLLLLLAPEFGENTQK